MNRRKFLTATALTTGASFILPSVRAATGKTPNSIQLAAIGFGRRGRDNIKNFIAAGKNLNARFVAVCDIDQWRLEEAKKLIEERYREQGIKHSVKTYPDYRELLKDPEVDAVQVVTPDHHHAAIAVAAVRAGKDVYLEKPLTYTIQEGRDLVRAVRENNRILQTGSQQRSSVYFRRVCELARNGKLGDIHTVVVKIPRDKGYAPEQSMPVPPELDYEAWLGNAPRKPYSEYRVHPQRDFSRPGWMQIEDYSHGMITNWGAHMLDIVQWGLGTDRSGPVRVEASAVYEKRGLWDVHTEITGDSHYANGIQVKLEAIDRDVSDEKPGVTFLGHQGWAHCERGAFDASDRNLLRWNPGPGDLTLYKSDDHFSDFLESVRTRKDPAAPVEVGHRSNSFCILYAISSKLKRPVLWNPDEEEAGSDEAANRMIKDMRIT